MARTATPSSLTGKLLFWATIITLATLIAVVIASTEVARRVMQRQILRSAEAAAEEVALELVAAREPLALLQEHYWSNKLMRRLSLRTGVRGIHIEVEVGGNRRTLIASSTETRLEPIVGFDEVPIGQLLARTSNEQLEVVVHQQLRDGELLIRVFASTEVIGTFLRVVYRNAAWMGLAAWLGLVLTIAIVIHTTITRPLRKVALKMLEVGEGQLRQRVDDVGTAELSPLIDSFNDMSSRLTQTEGERSELLTEVGQLNRRLQRRVQVATAALASAQADLVRRDRLAAMGELVGTIAHEVGTPLNSVLAHLDMLGEDLHDTADKDRLELVVREIERVGDVIRRYLKSTKSPGPRPAEVSIRELLTEAVYVFEAQTAVSEIEMTVEATDIQFNTDPDLLAQVIRNVVSNAINASGPGGRITVTASEDPGGLQITVADNGTGMSAEVQERIFEPFFSARQDETGTGLGMAIVRNIVTILGGRISVSSELGEGTSVNVFLARGSV